MFGKRALVSYDRYQPELQFGKCMMKYAHKQYPELMRYIRMQNIGKLAQNMYSVASEFISNAMNGGFQYDEIIVEHGRIGTKVEQMTRHRPTTMRYHRERQHRQRAKVMRQQIASTNFTSIQLTRNASQTAEFDTKTNRTTKDVRNRREYRHNMPDSTISDRINPTEIDTSHSGNKVQRSINAEPILYVGPRQFPSNSWPPLEQEPVIDADDDDINLANKPTDEIVEDFFDWEPVVLEGFGIDPKSIQKFSPTYCGKEYVFGFIKRFIHDFLLA